MATMIVMTQAQADAVRGETTPGHSLEPVKLADGATYVLGPEVLSDPDQKAKRAVLSAYPMRDVSPGEFGTAMLA